jgi:hypothetical protein
MRILLLALMIALLPIRGWAGNAMAVQMVATGVNQGSVHCADTAENQLTDTQSVQAAEQGRCSTCTVCQVFQLVALAGEAPMPLLHPLQHHIPMPLSTAYTNATAAPGLKPPIS